MNQEILSQLDSLVRLYVIPTLWKLSGALAIWVGGSWAIRLIRAAGGLAIGAAWSGLLANFDAGLFLLSFRPFKVGDSIAAAGITGSVREIGLFMTTIDTLDRGVISQVCS